MTTAQCESLGMYRNWIGRMVAQRRWVRLTTGVYDTEPVPVDFRSCPDLYAHRRRRLAWLGMLACGPAAIAVGQSAVALHGVQGLPVHIVPEVMLRTTAGRQSRAGIVVRQYDDGLETVRVGSRLAAAVLHALAQTVPSLDRRHAVAILDSAVHQRMISRAQVEVAHDLARGRRGVQATHEWWGLVDGRAESPLETFARLDCTDAGVPPDDLQRDFLGPDGRFLGRADLAWLLPDGRWLLLEVDGAGPHQAPEALFADRERQNRLVTEAGVIIQRTTSKELARPGVVGSAIAGILRARGWRPGRAPSDAAERL